MVSTLHVPRIELLEHSTTMRFEFRNFACTGMSKKRNEKRTIASTVGLLANMPGFSGALFFGRALDDFIKNWIYESVAWASSTVRKIYNLFDQVRASPQPFGTMFPPGMICIPFPWNHREITLLVRRKVTRQSIPSLIVGNFYEYITYVARNLLKFR